MGKDNDCLLAGFARQVYRANPESPSIARACLTTKFLITFLLYSACFPFFPFSFLHYLHFPSVLFCHGALCPHGWASTLLKRIFFCIFELLKSDTIQHKDLDKTKEQVFYLKKKV